MHQRFRVAVLFLCQDHAILGESRRAQQGPPVPGPRRKYCFRQFVRLFQARLSLLRFAEIKLGGNALNASHTPVAVRDVLTQSEITVSGWSQAIQVFESSRDQALPRLG